MGDETTHNLPNSHSFEERVFARFDTIDSRLDAMYSRFETIDSRLLALETQAERRALETKPIWERALAEIVEVKAEIVEVKAEIVEVKERLTSLESLSHRMVRKIDILSRDMLTLRADQSGLEDRLDKLDSEPA